MSSITKRLAGKNLDELHEIDNPSVFEKTKVFAIHKSSIYSGVQVRKHFDEEKLQELARSIEINGQELPIIVHSEDGKGYRIQSGERRWRAAMLSNEITHLDCVIRDTGDIFSQLIENIQRENLNSLELAESFLKAKEEFSLDNRKLAEKLGKSEVYISKHLQALNAPISIQDAFHSGLVGDIDTINTLRIAHGIDPDKVEQRLAENTKVTRREALELKAGHAQGKYSPELMPTPTPTIQPNTGMPDSLVPDTGTPDSLVPNTGTPDSGMPGSLGPNTGTPDSGMPGSLGPNTVMPDSGMPDSFVHDEAMPAKQPKGLHSASPIQVIETALLKQIISAIGELDTRRSSQIKKDGEVKAYKQRPDLIHRLKELAKQAKESS